MTQRFISAWCYEHDFSDKLGAIIYFEDLEEKDLNEDNFTEKGCYITIPNKEYTVFNCSDVDEMIEDKKSKIKDDILDLLHNSELIKDYIDWNRYFHEHEIDESDVLPSDCEEIDFYNNTYFIIEK